MTVAEFANELKKSTDTLLEQLKSAGVAKSAASDTLSESDKQHLLSYLQTAHGHCPGPGRSESAGYFGGRTEEGKAGAETCPKTA